MFWLTISLYSKINKQLVCTAAMSGGSNCAVVGCYTRRAKCRGLSFQKLPKKDKDAYFKRKPHYLKPGSLPTEYMPQKSIVTHKPIPRKVPLPRDPPLLPSCVKYMHFSELKKDDCNPQCLPSP
ncbi:hypothetical protein Bpfe_024588 [Biomphalaria pfeifferi]|uniref:Uncharacterized protein n=1 Tax=Biomphalaria pfeifferi TaxID=112525 RepID=A0AAD8F0X8_BIOPF|nr:hypothetical protein Bpfe_024588 [Biomphalaria pfeifferi]